MSATAPEALMERLRDLAVVEVDMLIAGASDGAAAEILSALVADLEDALGQARATIARAHAALGAGSDPLACIEATPAVRSRGGEPAVAMAVERLGERAAARRELACLEELVRGLVPRLLEADRRLMAVRPG